MRQIEAGEDIPNAVIVGVERDADGKVFAVVRWPAIRGEAAGEDRYHSVPKALEVAESVKSERGFGEIVVSLQTAELWRDEWGSLELGASEVTAEEAFDMAWDIEANRDA